MPSMVLAGLKVPGSLELFTTEHILPNKPEGDSGAGGPPKTLKRERDYGKLVGNLTLLEKPINIVAGGRDFYTAKQAEAQEQLLTCSLRRLPIADKHIHLADQRSAGGIPLRECIPLKSGTQCSSLRRKTPGRRR